MSLKALSASEIEIIRKTVEATFGYFTWDYQTRIGVEPERVRELLEVWPEVDDSGDDSAECLMINNSLNDLLHGEGISDEDSVRLTGCDWNELDRIYRKWAKARGWATTGIR